MNVNRITVTRAATVPTGQFANQRIEYTWEATLGPHDDPHTETTYIGELLDAFLLGEIAVIQAEHGQGSYTAQPGHAGGGVKK
jgi:hypothetical protein